MSNTIYPCLWFDGKAQEAAEFYVNLFPNSKLSSSNPMVSIFELNGTKFMGLNGGPIYQITPATSFYVYCGNEQELEHLYKALSEKGKINMPLDEYDWSKKYAWVVDQFGVNWQLDVADIAGTQKILPSLLFVNEKQDDVKKALIHYQSIFQNSSILLEAPYPDNSEKLLFAQFKLNDYLINAMSSTFKHEFDFSPGVSFVVQCETQAEIDHYWGKLGENGKYNRCGWLDDQFGVSWQIVPSVLSSLMSNPAKTQAVTQAFMQMTKFDIETLMNA